MKSITTGLASALLLVILLFSQQAIAAQHQLFTETGAADTTLAPSAKQQGPFRAATRSKQVTMLPQVSKADGLQKNDTLRLPLFADVEYTAIIDRVATNTNGTITVQGKIQGFPLAHILISTDNCRSLVTLEIPEQQKLYMIQYDPATQAHHLLELDPDKIDHLEDSPSPIPPPTSKSSSLQQDSPLVASSGVDDPATIRAMIVYTPAARQWADSSGGGINNVVNHAMEKAQLVLDNSGTGVTMTLALSQEVAYTESGDSGTDLNRLTNTGDGYLDEAHTLRDSYQADIVAMFTYISDTGGLGWLLGSPSGSPAYAFSINRVQQVGSGYTMIHEMGHNMGLHHHKAQTTQPGPGLYSFSAGWRWIADNNYYCSVMTYSPGWAFADGHNATQVPYYSNPSLTYIGVATGDAVDGDNARNVRLIKHVIAAYRETYSLSVGSSGVSSVSITGNPSTYSDTTPYSKTNIASGIAITLTAPMTSGSSSFSSWTGCDSSSTVTCTLYMTGDKTVTVNYATNPFPWPMFLPAITKGTN